jgi:hypothetical protein
MKNTALMFAVGLLLTACSKTPSDAAIRRQIVGTWTTSPSITMTIYPDGYVKIIHADYTFEGKWLVDGGYLIETITNYPSPELNEKGSHVLRYEIVRIDDHQLASHVPGQTNLFTATRQ